MSPEIRIGDTEREAAVAALGEHYAAGRLTKQEYDERADVAWTARTQADLRPLFADLPAPGMRPVGGPTPPASDARRRAPRRHGPRLPVLPMVLVVLGLVLLTHGPWLLFLLIGLFCWSRWARWSRPTPPGWRR
jgi:hypothetical protein